MGWQILALMLSLAIVGEGKLQLVINVLRHGAQQAKENTTIFPDITWDYYDEVTGVGLRQHTLLGRLRRQKYIETEKFLPAAYDPSLLYILTSDSRRTMVSAQAYLLGLYPNGLRQFNANQTAHVHDLLAPPIDLTISKQVIELLRKDPMPFGLPVHAIRSVDERVDEILRIDSCPYYDKKLDAYFDSEQYHQLLTQTFGPMWDEMKRLYPGITSKFLEKDDNAAYLADFVICADYEGMRPKLISDKLLAELKRFWATVLREELSSDSLLTTIGVAGLVREILGHMNATIEGRLPQPPKYVVLVGHSKTMGFLLLGLHRFNSSIDIVEDRFACDVLFELTAPEDSPRDPAVYQVTIYYP